MIRFIFSSETSNMSSTADSFFLIMSHYEFIMFVFLLSSIQTVFTLRRKWAAPAPKLNKSGKINRALKQKYKVYIPDGQIRPKKLLKLILTEDVEGMKHMHICRDYHFEFAGEL